MNQRMNWLKWRIYGLFVSAIVSLCVAITLLVLEIVFNYIGFVSSDLTQYSCSDSYLYSKYSYVQHQLQVAFLGTCLAIAILIPLLVLTLLSAKYLYQYTTNEQDRYQQYIPAQIMSKIKFIVIYVLASIGAVGDVVSFGYYLTFWFESHKDPNTCLFIYNSSNLIALIILSGLLLLAFLILHVFLFIIRRNFAEQQEIQSKQDKYKETMNITEQQGLIKNQNVFYNYTNQQYAEQHFQGDTSSFGNKQFHSKENYDAKNIRYNQNQSILNSQNSFNGNNNKKGKQTFQQYRARQLKEFKDTQINEKDQNHDNKNTHVLSNDYFTHTTYQHEPGQKSQNVLKFYQNGKKVNDQPSDHQRMISFGKQNDNKVKPYSPIRMLAQNANQNSNQNNQYGKFSPNKSYNNQNHNLYPQKSQRGAEQDTRHQLVFYKKAMQKSRRDEDEDPHSRFNENKEPYNKNINKNNQNPFSSGEVSFKSPSRFDSKFTEEQNDYLKRNAQNSILPSNNIIEVTDGSRKRVFDDKYSSSGIAPSNFAQSRNIDSSPSQSRSRTNGRDGVLTGFIRGKFS